MGKRVHIQYLQISHYAIVLSKQYIYMSFIVHVVWFRNNHSHELYCLIIHPQSYSKGKPQTLIFKQVSVFRHPMFGHIEAWTGFFKPDLFPYSNCTWYIYLLLFTSGGKSLKLRIFPFNIYNPNLLYSKYPFVLNDISSHCGYTLNICQTYVGLAE